MTTDESGADEVEEEDKPKAGQCKIKIEFIQDVLMKAIAERGRYESLPIFFCRDAINLQLSMSEFVRANPL